MSSCNASDHHPPNHQEHVIPATIGDTLLTVNGQEMKVVYLLRSGDVTVDLVHMCSVCIVLPIDQFLMHRAFSGRRGLRNRLARRSAAPARCTYIVISILCNLYSVPIIAVDADGVSGSSESDRRGRHQCRQCESFVLRYASEPRNCFS